MTAPPAGFTGQHHPGNITMGSNFRATFSTVWVWGADVYQTFPMAWKQISLGFEVSNLGSTVLELGFEQSWGLTHPALYPHSLQKSSKPSFRNTEPGILSPKPGL